MATLTWMDRKGAGRCETGDVHRLAGKLKNLRCEATLRDDSGEVIGESTRIDYADDKRIKWNWWYDQTMVKG